VIESAVNLEVQRVANRDGDGSSDSAPRASGKSDRGFGQPTVIGASADEPLATLKAIDGDLEGHGFVLRAGENHLGRGADCSPVMNSRWISRSHARVFCQDGLIRIRATEGKEIWVNDVPAVEQDLKDGDRIRLGTTTFMLGSADAETKSESGVIPVTLDPSEAGQSSPPEARPSAAVPKGPGDGRPSPVARRKKSKWRFWVKSAPTLVFVTGERSGERVALESPRFRIGALEENDIVVRGKDASRNHAELRIRDGRVHIWDLRSVNGTWVNNQRIENTELRFGDVVRIGSEELRYED
jgi:pSer/pThr/pTyr-binding forkhead associated (FHA) protein